MTGTWRADASRVDLTSRLVDVQDLRVVRSGSAGGHPSGYASVLGQLVLGVAGLDYKGGVSVMGVDWAKSSFKTEGRWDNVEISHGSDLIFLDRRRINLPENVKHVGKFEELFILEHKNGKVKEGSVLCLLNSKEDDPNTLALFEHQIKAAENLAASLRIFAEVLKAEGQTIEPAPLQKTKKKKGT